MAGMLGNELERSGDDGYNELENNNLTLFFARVEVFITTPPTSLPLICLGIII